MAASSNSNFDEQIIIILQKLHTLEPSIKEIFSVGSPASILKEKLNQLEAVVMEIPEEYVGLTTEWRPKLAGWFRDYCCMLAQIEFETPIVSSTSNDVLGNQLPSSSSSVPIESSTVRSYHVSSLSSAPQANSVPIANTPTLANNIDTNVNRPAVHQDQPVVNSTSPDNANNNYSNDQQHVIAQVEEAFKLARPVTDFTILEDLKRFSKLVARVDVMLEPFWRDQELQVMIMRGLSEKIPPANWEEFLANGDIKTIRNFKRFLVNYLKRMYDQLKTEAEQSEQQAQLNGNGDQGDEKFCKYCRSNNHVYEDCFYLKYTLCYICLEDGHTSRRCPLNQQQGGGGGRGSADRY